MRAHTTITTIAFAITCSLYHSNAITGATSCNSRNWGDTTVISNPWEYGKGHDSATHVPDQTFWLMPKKKSTNAPDEAIVIAYIARQIVDHGGYFCATQIRSRNSGKTGCPKIWTQYQNPSGNIESTCFWLCEPGYSGPNCPQVDKPTADACKYTHIDRQTLSADISYQETGAYDTASVEETMKSNCNGFFLHSHGNTKKGNEQDVVLAAREFLENGHGIIASPATVSAHGGWWNAENYTDEDTNCTGGNSNITITANGATYKSKTLCMPGFSGEGCTTNVCSTCDNPLTKFNTKTGSCSDCIENYVHDENGTCVKCPDGEIAVADQDKCIKCKNTEYLKDGKCVPRKPISKQTMYSCYPNHDDSDFIACVKSTCTKDKKTVACVTENKKIGKKTCDTQSGTWGRCIESQ